MSPDSATRLGSARLRAAPFVSSALTATCSRFDKLPDQKAERCRTGQHAARRPPAKSAELGGRHVGAADAGADKAALLERAIRLRDRQLRSRQPGADIGERRIAEHVPLHAEVAAGRSGRLR